MTSTSVETDATRLCALSQGLRRFTYGSTSMTGTITAEVILLQPSSPLSCTSLSERTPDPSLTVKPNVAKMADGSLGATCAQSGTIACVPVGMFTESSCAVFFSPNAKCAMFMPVFTRSTLSSSSLVSA